MHNYPIEYVQADSSEYIALSKVIVLCGIAQNEADELMEYGAIKLHHSENNQGFLTTQHSITLQKACQMRQHFDLDLFTVAICVDYLETIAMLQSQLRQYQT
jgi:hypothetical protein